MKYYLKTSMLFFVIFALNGCSEINTISKCPILDKQNKTEDEILISKRIQKDFDEYAPNLKKIYLDVLQAYNSIIAEKRESKSIKFSCTKYKKNWLLFTK